MFFEADVILTLVLVGFVFSIQENYGCLVLMGFVGPIFKYSIFKAVGSNGMWHVSTL